MSGEHFRTGRLQHPVGQWPEMRLMQPEPLAGTRIRSEGTDFRVRMRKQQPQNLTARITARTGDGHPIGPVSHRAELYTPVHEHPHQVDAGRCGRRRRTCCRARFRECGGTWTSRPICPLIWCNKWRPGVDASHLHHSWQVMGKRANPWFIAGTSTFIAGTSTVESFSRDFD